MTPARKDPEDVKKTFLKIRVTEESLERWQAAAVAAKKHDDDAEDLDFSSWVRRALNRAEREEARTRARKKESK